MGFLQCSKAMFLCAFNLKGALLYAEYVITILSNVPKGKIKGITDLSFNFISCVGIFSSKLNHVFAIHSFLLTQSGSSKESTRGTMWAELRISSNTLRKASSYNLNSGSIRISLSSRTKCSTNPGCL